jgi:RNA polymerase sigma-70 factor (ECF subfamily)
VSLFWSEDFTILIEPVKDKLYQYCFAISSGPEEAKDLYTDTLLAALEKYRSLRDETRMLGFLLKIASRLDKRRRWRNRRLLPWTDEIEQPACSSDSIERNTDASLVREALLSLTIKVRETVVLSDIADLSLEEIRQLQGGTLSGVKSRLKRGREQLMRELGVASAAQRLIVASDSSNELHRSFATTTLV